VRADDLAAGSDAAGASMFIQEGTLNADKGFVCTSNSGSAVVGTDALTFSQFTGASNITAGEGLTKTGDTLDVNVDDSSIEIASDALQVKALGITNGMLAGSIANAKLANSSVSFGGVSLSLGGTDATPAFDLTDATNYPTSSLVGTITNAQLAGSIANEKLEFDGISLGGVSISLGGTDATPAFDLSDATNYPTSSLTGTIATSQIAYDAVTAAKIADGAVGAAALASSAVTTVKINDQAVTSAKMGFIPSYETVGTGDGSATTFDAASVADSNYLAGTLVFRNGLAMELVDSSPSGQDQYSLSADGGTGGVMRITFGSAPNNGDVISALYFTTDLS
jgi:hypothetical protein